MYLLKLVTMMKIRLLFLLILHSSSADLDTEYYANLINEEATKATTFQLPTSNEEFRGGYESQNIEDAGNYDFIIIGSGSAGSVVATRLSECSGLTILLLEAGGEESDFTQIPAMLLHSQFSPNNWGYYSTPQEKCCQGMVDQKCIIPRGKLLGGSSSINAVMNVRGNPADYDKWVTFGNPGWSYKECLPYFKKSENSQIDGDEYFHGKGGLWNVQYAEPASPYLYNFLNATEELNLKVLDYNGRKQIGSGRVQYNIKHGRRQSTNVAFLDMARRRRNLKVITKALVTKILINPTTKIATGVEFVTTDKKYKAGANKEVIVSAGATNTPQILMLSGIGPKEELQALGIDVIVDSPVGKNLLEHPLFPGFAYRTNVTLPNVGFLDIIDLYLDGLGPLTKPAAIEGVLFIHTGPGSKEVPTTEAIFIPPTGSDLSIFSRALNFNDALIANFLAQLDPKTDGLIFLALLHEDSTGDVTLNSSSPLDFPKINLNMLDKQKDVDTIADGIRVLYKLFDTEAFKQLNGTVLDIPICQEFTARSKEFLECLIRKMTATTYHLCGTAPMGSNRTVAVVDTNLRVHGIKRLRVVDASIFPSTISGHTNAPTVMVAEKISDYIKRLYKCSSN